MVPERELSTDLMEPFSLLHLDARAAGSFEVIPGQRVYYSSLICASVSFDLHRGVSSYRKQAWLLVYVDFLIVVDDFSGCLSQVFNEERPTDSQVLNPLPYVYTLPYSTLSYLTLTYLILPCLILISLPYLTLPCLALSYFTMPHCILTLP